MSATAKPLNLDGLTLAAAARIIRDGLRDKSYERTPIGAYAKRYLRWFRNEYGATPATIRDYEPILARMSMSLGDKQLIEVTTEDLRAVIDLWSHCTASTRQKIVSILHSFWEWCYDEGHIAIDPASRIRRPKGERKLARPLPVGARPRLLEAASHPRDRLGLFLLLTCGVRRSELASVQIRDLDPVRRTILIHGKGRKQREIPLRGLAARELLLLLSTDLPAVGRPPEADDFLIYPIERQTAGRGKEGQLLWRHVGFPKRQYSGAGMQRWWYRIAQDAGVVGRGQTRDFNMHRARHLFAMELRRVAGIEAASQALGHAELSTTLGIYGHQDQTDLEDAMELYHAFLDAQDKENMSPEDEGF